MTQVMQHCKQMINANIMVSAQGGTYLTFNLFGTNVIDITQSETVASDIIIGTTPFKLTHKNNVVTSICRT